MTLLTPFLPQSIRYGSNAFPDVEPFSIRAAASYEDIQYSMVVWIRDQLTPYLAANIPQGVWDENAANLTAAVTDQLNAAVAQLAAGSIPVTDAGVAHFITVAPQPLGAGQDDTANLNAAFAKPGIVVVPQGIYTAGTGLTIAGTVPTRVIGTGATINSTVNDAILRVSNGAHTVEGLTLVGAGTAQPNQAGILNYSPRATIRGNSVSNVSRFGIFTSSADDVLIADNKTDSTSLSTANTDAPSVAAIMNDNGNHVTITRNICTNTRWGINVRSDAPLQNVKGCLVADNFVSCSATIAAADPTCQGLSASWTDNCKTVNNTAIGYSNNSIDHHGCRYDVIEGNTLGNGLGDGIFVGDNDSATGRDTRATTIANNSIHGCSTGIRVWNGAQYVAVTGNAIDSYTTGGIIARGSVDSGNTPINNVTIANNIINSENNATGPGIWVSAATGTQITGNQVNRPGTQCVLVQGSDMTKIQDNVLQSAGYKQTAGQMDSVLTDSPRTFIRTNMFYGGNGAGVNITGGQNSSVVGNRFRSITGASVTDAGTTTTQSDNLTV